MPKIDVNQTIELGQSLSDEICEFRDSLYKVINCSIPRKKTYIDKNLTIREGSLYKYNSNKRFSLDKLLNNHKLREKVRDEMDEDMSRKFKKLFEYYDENIKNPLIGYCYKKHRLDGVYCLKRYGDYVLAFRTNSSFRDTCRVACYPCYEDENITRLLHMKNKCMNNYSIISNSQGSEYLVTTYNDNKEVKVKRKYKEMYEKFIYETTREFENNIECYRELRNKLQQNFKKEIVSINLTN